jgi:ATP-dependent helicase Lhr and Lhr-like helicase
MLKVRLVRARGARREHRPDRARRRVLGEIEEYFIETLVPGDTFLFAGECCASRASVENEAMSRAPSARRRSQGAVL